MLPPLLSAAQRREFETQGFLVLPNYCPEAVVHGLKSRMSQLLSDFDPVQHKSQFFGDNGASDDAYLLDSGDKIRFFLEPAALDAEGQLSRPVNQCVNKAGHALHDLDSVFRQATDQLAFGQLAAELGQAQPQALQSMYLFKQPRIGAPVALHQDATFLYTEPASVLGFWLALDHASEENGCLWALPGGHRLGLKRRMRRVADGTKMELLDPNPFPDNGLTPLPVDQGSLVILHGLLPHLSQPNRSTMPRHAYSLHLVDGAAHYPQDNWLQRAENRPGS